MKTFDIFWIILNWPEFVLYVLVPISFILIILVYIYFNLELLFITFQLGSDSKDIIEKLDEN